MIVKDIEDKVIAYFEGELNSSQHLELDKLSKEDSCVAQLMKEYQSMYQSFDDVETHNPSENLQNGFDSFLKDLTTKVDAPVQDSKETKIIQLHPAYKMVAAACLLIIGVFVGIEYSKKDTIHDINNQMAHMRTEIKQLMNEESSMSRIQAVSMTNNVHDKLNQTDISSLLIKTLEEDKSSNVRLAAVQSLENYLSVDEVRVALINALNTEKDGTVLIEIIQLLAHYKDKTAIENLEKLTKDEELYKFVRDEAHLGIIQITST